MMDPDRGPTRVPFDEKAVFLAALSMAEADREPFLQGACPGEVERARMRTLLSRHAETTSQLLSPGPHASPIPEGEGEGEDIELPFRLGDFELRREIGRGGMGVVYLARDLTLRRDVAVKILDARYARSPRFLASFKQEAIHASQLQHPAIVPVYLFGSSKGIRYIVTPYIDGRTLRQHLDDAARARPKGSAARQWHQEVASTLAMVAEALEQAHVAGIVHRDVKPSNIMIDGSGKPHLLDFGIAMRSGDETSLLAVSQMGSSAYASPEQRHGGQVDGRSDVYSLGVVLFEALAGRLPFESGASGNQGSNSKREAPSLRRLDQAIPRDLDVICQMALAESSTDRYQSAGHLAADLRAWLNDRPILARPEPAWRRLRRRYQRHRVAAVALLAACVAVVITGTVLVMVNDPRPSVIIVGVDPDVRVFVQPLSEPFATPMGASSGVGRRFRVEEGLYRVTVIDSSGAYAEFSRWLGANTTTRLTPRLRAGDADAQTMVLFDPVQFPVDPSIRDGYAQIASTLTEPFLLDRYEVSNAQYEAFVQDPTTDAPPPPIWGGPSCPPQWRDWPVVGITWGEAQAYAEWCGKRLPTAPEWLYAARGPKGRRYSTAESAPDPSSLGVTFLVIPGYEEIRTAAYRPAGSDEARTMYQAGARAVHDTSTLSPDLTPEGVANLFGNVREWTGSRPLDEDALAPERLVLGHCWETPISGGDDLTAMPEQPMDARIVGIGFRCARSIPR